MPDTHWRKLTNPYYLGAWDFAPGEERTLTIRRVVQEQVYDPEKKGKKECTVVHFAEPSKPMIMCKTNCKMITKLCDTPYIEKWAGRAIVVKVEKVKAFGELVEALRVQNKTADAPPPIPACGDCGREITGFDNYSAAQVAATTLKNYGVVLCSDCGAKRKEKSNAAGA